MRKVVLLAAVAVSVGLGLWWLGDGDPAPERDAAALQPPGASAPEEPAGPLPGPVSAPESAADVDALDAAADYRRRVRGFLDAAGGLAGPERIARAETLAAETRRREQAGTLLPAESAYLQLALLRASVTDPAALRERSEALLARYRARSEAGWEEFRADVDPRHQAYRAAERELVLRAAGDDPDALSAAELRARLQALREQYYGSEPLQ